MAQSAVDGAVVGTVLDSSGAALSNAVVAVHNTATNADVTAATDSSGYFRVSRLVPGIYTVKVTAAGFSDYSAAHVTVEVGKLTEVKPTLGAAGTTATVDVSSEVPVINSETSDFTSEFNPTALSTLPINGRHWTAFALNSPGVTLGNSSFGLVTFRGASNLQNNFMVDGSDDNQSFQSVERGYTRVGYSSPQDAILEFQVLTSNVSAQYGRAEGGGVNAVTRSGSNQFHGDAFEYYRDNDFGATNPFNTLVVPVPGTTTGATETIHIKPTDKRHQYGGSFSGPLIHDKLFFLFAFDQQKRNFPSVATPTPQFLQDTNSADNSCTIAGGTALTDAQSCALARGVPQADINAAMAYINGQSGLAPRKGDQILNFAKLDYKINDKNNASIIYNRMRWDSPNGIQTNLVNRRGITSFGNDFVKVDSIIGKIDTIITPKMINEFRIEYARDYEFENGDTPLANEPTTTAGGLPPGVIITPNSGFSMGTPYYVPRSSYPNESEEDAVDNLTWSRGNHTLNIGGEYRWAQDNIIDVDYEHGLFTYALLADWFTDFAHTAGAPAPTPTSVGCDSKRDTGTGALPCFTGVQQAFGHPQFVYHTNEYAGYVQDDWKIRKRLTINLGVRYDFEQLPTPKIPNPNIPQTGVFPSDKHNFSPRVGFAWDAFGTGKTLVHGGFGMYYGRIQNGMIYDALKGTGSPNAQFSVTTTQAAAGASGLFYPYLVSAATAPAVSNIAAFAPGFKNPYSEEFNVSIQQDLGWKTIFGIAYLGSLGKALPNFVDNNVAPATQAKTYTFTNGPLAGDVWTVPLYTARINPAYNVLTLITSNINTNYNALVATLDHRLAKGVQVSASYTWSRAMDYNMNQSAVSDTNDPTDPFNLHPDYGRSANDLPQRFVGNITLQPTFHLANKFASLAANGWTLAPLWTVQSGLAYSYGISGGSALAGGGTTFNGSGGTPTSAAGSEGAYVDFKAYPQYAAQDVFKGISPSRNTQTGVTMDDVDVRLSRSFSIAEKYKLTLSGEAFNILNRQNFTAYNTGAYTLTTGATANVGSANYVSTFGTPSGAANTIFRERQIQFVGRFEF
ncbi:TonB-dependent receptor domain-containing protein [Granulicella arctica]|uniref:TonB-dependent transporter Oar-like beta-barrel domain-containing protein n=1 Tax=Granulicella arctica TaxID=940613 RepID=A0A7Y9PFM7_9BACT|nr:TonB-dependent receptor [Granulicella arctica]NYF79055.1 hypothetical protein [Granulicella arctica]